MTAHPLNRWPAPKTFDVEGDEIKGTVIAWDGSDAKYPTLHIRTADGLIRVVRVTQVRLHERLADLLPNPGDRLWIRYDGESERAALPGLSKTKEFTVEIRRQGSQDQGRPGNTSGSATENVPDPGVNPP